jgi:hypothetical protein
MPGIFAISIALLGLQASASADVVTFENGRTMDCVILNDNKETLRVQFGWGGFMTIEKKQVTKVEKQDAATNRKLLDSWKKQNEAKDRQLKEDAIFEQQQREKGFIKYNGRWMTKDEIDLLRSDEKERDEERQRQTLQEEVTLLKQRIQLLEYENSRLQQQLNDRQTIFVTPPVQVIQKPRRRNRVGTDGTIVIEGSSSSTSTESSVSIGVGTKSLTDSGSAQTSQ